MATVSGFPRICSGFINISLPKLPFWNQRCNNEIRIKDYNTVQPLSRRAQGGIQNFPAVHSRSKHGLSLSARRGPYMLSYNDGLPKEPVWLTSIKEAMGAMKTLFSFLAEQPSQLKYIEWPSFGSTLRTAILTLVIVAFLIVALSAVDSVLCYLMALILRTTP